MSIDQASGYKHIIFEYEKVIYSLKNESKTAFVVGCNKINIFIPRTIRYQNNEFLVIGISKDAFKNPKIKSVEFAKNSEIRIIEANLFQFTSIESIIIPASVQCIEKEAFNCHNLHHIEFANNSQLQKICDHALTNAPIEKIEIPSSLIEIGEASFSFCQELKKIIFPNDSNLQIINKNAFLATQIEEITFPPKLKELKEG